MERELTIVEEFCLDPHNKRLFEQEQKKYEAEVRLDRITRERLKRLGFRTGVKEPPPLLPSPNRLLRK